MAIVLVCACGMGWWVHWRKQAAVDAIIATLPMAKVLVGIGPTQPQHNATLDNTGLLEPGLRRIHQLRAERLAGPAIARILDEARASGNETLMRSSLGVLERLGPEVTAARPALVRLIRSDGFSAAQSYNLSSVRCVAVHLLGKVAAEDEAAIDDLITLLKRQDDSFDHWVSASIANELSIFGAKSKAAVPVLVSLLEAEGTKVQYQAVRVSVVSAIQRLGSAAADATPALKRLIRDADPFVRGNAVWALDSIARDTAVVPRDELRALVSPLVQDEDQWVRQMATQCLSRLQFEQDVRERQVKLQNLIAADRALNGRPRPKASDPPF
jgi:hypothetical protein